MTPPAPADQPHPFTSPTGGEVKPRAGRLVLLLAVPLLAGLSPPAPDDPSVGAYRAFADGVAHRADSAAARARFREAAAGFDAVWRQGHRTPALAVDRGRTHRLAGDLPRAVAALAAGHAAARYDRDLQHELEDARSAVVYPLDGDLAGQCRPPPVRGVAARMSPAEAWLVALGLWVGACLAAARFVMTRNLRWVAVAAGCVIALAVLGGLWWDDARRHDPRPVVVVAADTPLRAGNGDSYPPRLDRPLPRGVEARELARRGGWAQVELAGGAVGWLPDRLLIRAE